MFCSLECQQRSRRGLDETNACAPVCSVGGCSQSSAETDSYYESEANQEQSTPEIGSGRIQDPISMMAEYCNQIEE